MKIIINKKSRSVSNEELEYAIKWMARLLMGSRLSNALTIHVKFKRERGNAYMTWLDSNHLPREYEIQLDPACGRKSLLTVLAHELVHVKQYAKGEMKALMNHKIKWRGEYVSDTDIDYWDYPWEIEAYGREHGIYFRYEKHIREQEERGFKISEKIS